MCNYIIEEFIKDMKELIKLIFKIKKMIDLFFISL
jgi:hypothetical protein